MIAGPGKRKALRAHPQINGNTDKSILSIRWWGPDPFHRLLRIGHYSQWQAAKAVALKNGIVLYSICIFFECSIYKSNLMNP